MKFDNFNKVYKFLLLFPIWGFIASGIYRIIYYFKVNKSLLTLIVGIICFVPFVGFFVSIGDFVTILINRKLFIFIE